ncbi:hypothetical protein HPB48_012593 [Haemaphysalis longicornis]|uniref:Uncharacterized protein n=1 Tax=Haemaphysalis longicornis TaxID=44386 RepID=A0A9J6G7W0_HAELO|nr:hypothetical protein HPB48_012593 [Haemaphysalis longicornis]
MFSGITEIFPLRTVKAAWSKMKTTCLRNCFRDAGFVDSQPEAEAGAFDGHCGGHFVQRVIDSEMVAMTWAGTILFLPINRLTLRNRARTSVSLMKCGARAVQTNRARTTRKLLSLPL